MIDYDGISNSGVDKFKSNIQNPVFRKSYESINLPIGSSDHICLLEKSTTKIVDLNLNELRQIEKWSPLTMTNNHLYLRNQDDLKKIGKLDLSNNQSEIEVLINLTHFQGSTFHNKRVIQNFKEKTTYLYDLENDKILWTYKSELESPLLGYRLTDQFVIGGSLDAECIACWDVNNGELLWNISIKNYSELKNSTKKIGDPFLFSDIIFGFDFATKTLHGINLYSQDLLWYKQIFNWHTFKLYDDKTFHAIGVNHQGNLMYIKIDLKTGFTIKSINLKEVFTNNNLEISDYYNLEGTAHTINALIISDHNIYFGIGKTYFQLNNDNNTISIVYENKAPFFTARILQNKIFLTDRFMNLMVLS